MHLISSRFLCDETFRNSRLLNPSKSALQEEGRSGLGVDSIHSWPKVVVQKCSDPAWNDVTFSWNSFSSWFKLRSRADSQSFPSPPDLPWFAMFDAIQQEQEHNKNKSCKCGAYPALTNCWFWISHAKLTREILQIRASAPVGSTRVLLRPHAVAGQKRQSRGDGRQDKLSGLLNPKEQFQTCLAPIENKPKLTLLVYYAKRTPWAMRQPSMVAWAWPWAAGEGKGMPSCATLRVSFKQVDWRVIGNNHPWTPTWIQILASKVSYSKSRSHTPNLKSTGPIRQKLFKNPGGPLLTARGVVSTQFEAETFCTRSSQRPWIQ